MIITNKVTVHLDSRREMPELNAVQGDSGRSVKISLLYAKEPWVIPEGTTAIIRYKNLRTGTGGVYDTMPDGTSAYSFSENTVTLYLPKQVFGVDGRVELQVTLLQDGVEISVFSLKVHVHRCVTDDVMTEADYENLEEHIRAEVDAAVQKLELPNALWVSVTSAVDEDGVYIGGMVADKTYAQIRAANEAGQAVYCLLAHVSVLTLAEIDGTGAVFQGVVNREYQRVVINSDDTVTYSSGKYALLDEVPTDGKSAYDYAKDGGYTGTEAEFAAKLAEELPSKVSQLTNDSDYAPRSELPKTFYVVVDDNGDGTGTSDKTLDEILAAHENGSVIICRVDSAETIGVVQNLMTFAGTAAMMTGVSADGTFWAVMIEHDGTLVANVPFVPETLPNPNALTINGQTYDGSAAVNVEIKTDDVPEHVRAEAERVAKLVQSRQNANTVTMMFGSDIHARLGLNSGSQLTSQMLASTQHAAQAMKIIGEQVHLDFAGLLGDFIWDEGETTEQAMEMYRLLYEYFHPAFNGVAQFWAKGNHDMLGNSAGGSVELTDAQVFAGIGIHNAGAVYDGANKVLGYCHRDLEDSKLRVICMNTSETRNSHAVGTAQINWLKTVLDVEDGWKVIILSHIPLDWWGTSATVYTTIAGFGDKILCNIHGHTHNYITGMVGDTSIPRIGIPNIDFYRANTYAGMEGFGEDTTYNKTADSASDTAFCVITIDLAENKLYADHYGAGIDREVDLNSGSNDDGGETAAYTNQIPLSINTDGSLYNGGVGYKTGTRVGSGGTESSASGMCCTGFIPVDGTSVVRIKNVTIAGMATPYLILSNKLSTGIVISGSLSGESSFPAADGNGVITINIGDLNPDATYMRLSCGVIDDTSIITVNEEIA